MSLFHLIFFSFPDTTWEGSAEFCKYSGEKEKKNVFLSSVLMVCAGVFEAGSICLFAQSILKEPFL